jgi:hypothetical protein
MPSALEKKCVLILQQLHSPNFILTNIEFNKTLWNPGRKLRADFFGVHECFKNDEINLSFWVIELDGPQHFDASHHYNMLQALSKQRRGQQDVSSWDILQASQTRDIVKHMWCLENHIHVCRIPFNEHIRMQDHLLDFFNKITLSKENNKTISYLVDIEKYDYLV